MDKIKEQLQSHAPSDTMEVDGSEGPADLDTLVNECKFSMKLHMADSAWKQVRKYVYCIFLLSFVLLHGN